jgi:cytochrome c peroxidase
MRFIAIFFGLIFLVVGFRSNQSMELIFPNTWPEPVYNRDTYPLDEQKVELGRALFFDPQLSADNTISCASCHSPYNAFTHVDHQLSHGIEDRIGTRNSPAIFNLAWQKDLMWDGAIHHIDAQALAPINHSDEMGSSINEVVKKLNNDERYRKAFKSIYNDGQITGERVLKLLGQFMISLVSCDSKYDRVMSAKEKFDDQEKRGYELFCKNCSECHKEPLFSDFSFRNNGLEPDPQLMDIGRMKITLNSMDSLKFKVPSLRNIEFSFPYMHDGRYKKLTEVIDHYDRKIHLSNTLDPILEKGIHFTTNEKIDLVAFLLTLTDKNFMFAPEHGYPKDFFEQK